MKDEALKLALEALKELVAQTETGLFAIRHDHVAMNNAREAITAVKQALNDAPHLAAPVQEPVAFKHVCNLWIDPVTTEYIVDHCDHPPSECIPAYIGTPPAAQRQWVGLTDEEVYPLANAHLHYQMEGYEVSGIYNLARAIEAKLKEKNT